MNDNVSLNNWIAECERLRKENTYLKSQLASLLQQKATKPNHIEEIEFVTKHSPDELKINLYRSLFKGRSDVYALRWESKDGKSGYLPACSHEWQRPICLKPEIKCSDCKNRTLLPLTDQVIADHIKGEHIIGIYPMHKDETCSFLAVDFDKKNWQQDVLAFTRVCKQFGIPYSIERSRSGNGAHVWFFFSTQIQAFRARKLGFGLLSKALEKRHEVGMDSFDRMFPNQDTLPKGGFGNLIALPLQREAGKKRNSLFVDENFTPYSDQWIYLSTIQKISNENLSNFLTRLHEDTGSNEDYITTKLPNTLTVKIRNGLYIRKDELPSSVITKITDIASIKNPEFYKAQANRMSTSGIPRIINCTDDDQHYLILPRGNKEDLEKQMAELNLQIEYEDETYEGEPIEATFTGKLTSLQADAVSQLLLYDNGVLSATTGFGKTVAAAALIAEQKVNTMIIVDRTQLQQQWINQLSTFLNLPKDGIGEFGGRKKKLTGKIDVVTLQSITSKGEVKSFITQYGQIIVDECHHISAITFERLLKHIRAKYVYGLTATPRRKDGLHPIIYMQCGPIRYHVDAKTQAKVRPFLHRLISKKTTFSSTSTNIQELYKLLAADEDRNQQLFDDVLHALEGGRSPIILTERIEHIKYLKNQFKGFAKNIIVLTGNMSKKEQKAELERLSTIPDSEERLIIATGKYIGEGFDDVRLDTLFLAMPISWKGTLQQYVGRLHRLHENKQEVRVYDYVDHHVPVLKKMFEKRLVGYKSMGYITNQDDTGKTEQMMLF